MQGTAAGNGQPAAQSKLRELRQRARATCFVPLSTSRKKGLILEVMCEMMSASRKRGLFLEVKPVNVTGLRSPGHSVQKMQNNRNFTLSHYLDPSLPHFCHTINEKWPTDSVSHFCAEREGSYPLLK